MRGRLPACWAGCWAAHGDVSSACPHPSRPRARTVASTVSGRRLQHGLPSRAFGRGVPGRSAPGWVFGRASCGVSVGLPVRPRRPALRCVAQRGGCERRSGGLRALVCWGSRIRMPTEPSHRQFGADLMACTGLNLSCGRSRVLARPLHSAPMNRDGWRVGFLVASAAATPPQGFAPAERAATHAAPCSCREPWRCTARRSEAKPCIARRSRRFERQRARHQRCERDRRTMMPREPHRRAVLSRAVLCAR